MLVSRELPPPEQPNGGDRAPRIFVRIAAYRDSECEWTLKDLFEKAAAPERVFAGVCWQYLPGEDSPNVRLHAFPEHVRLTRVSAERSLGTCWARRCVEELHRGEEYTLQIDAHTRFEPEWDRLLLEELAACPGPKPVLSCNPAAYTPPHDLARGAKPSIRVALPFSAAGKLRFRGERLDRFPERPLNGAFVAGGFVFSASSLLHEVPYDPELYFDQEEAAYGVRLFTHGWDVFSASRIVLYHYYNQRDQGAASVRPLHWQDNLEWRRYDQRGQRRFEVLTGARSGAASEGDLGRYGLGSERTLSEYEEYSGIDFKRRHTSDRAQRGLFVRDLERYKAAPSSTAEAPRPRPSESSAPVSLPERSTGAWEALELRERDCVPFFALPDRGGRSRELQARGGSFTLFVLAPELDTALAAELRSALRSVRASSLEVIVITRQDGPSARELGLELWLDASGDVFRLFGAVPGAALPVLVDPSLRVASLEREGSTSARIQRAQSEWRLRYRAQKLRVVSAQAPVLLIPDVLDPKECRRLVSYFETHPRADGKVGASPSVYQPANKIRTDCFVEGEMQAYIDQRLARRVLPEIEKVYGLAITHRETYKIGCYDGARGGFFFRHRDNLDPALSYRRYAALVNLNDDFVGGELCFPEYGNVAYRPAQGHAIVFACSLVHEVQRLRKGRRYILQGFLFGEQDAARCPRIRDRHEDAKFRLDVARVALGLAR